MSSETTQEFKQHVLHLRPLPTRQQHQEELSRRPAS